MNVAVVILVVLLGVALAAPEVSTNFQFRNMFRNPLPGARRSQGRIINGQIADPHSIPHQAFLTVYQGRSGWYCGGSLIATTVVITAGHCGFEAERAEIVLGAQNPSNDEVGQITVSATKFVVHEKFDMDLILYDIALIILPNEVELTDFIKLVPLPEKSRVGISYVGETGKVSGWGLTDGESTYLSPVLRYTENPIISNAECNDTYGIVEDYEICMSGADGHSACNGDSGGPLTVDGVLVGIVSYGTSNCETGYPSAFTRTTSFLDWIETHSKSGGNLATIARSSQMIVICMTLSLFVRAFSGSTTH